MHIDPHKFGLKINNMPPEINNKLNPKHTKDFSSYIKRKSDEGKYRVEITIGSKTIRIDVFPTVFPPDYAPSSESVFEAFGDLKGKIVADIGTGTGIQAIVATLAGADHVDASDINPQAVICAENNIRLNGLEEKISCFNSDLFSKYPVCKYDLIIANLPFVNFNVAGNFVDRALYDNDFLVHKRFFGEAKNFLASDGQIYLPHANLQSAESSNPRHDFEIMEQMIYDFGYEIIDRTEKIRDGFAWINYKLKLK